MRMSERKKKSILIGALLAVVVLMGIAYAAFASNLTITGTGNTTNNWDVRITNIRGVNECLSVPETQVSTPPNVQNKLEYIPNAEGSGKVEQMGGSSCGKNDASDITPPTKSVDGLSATFNTGLVQPGDTRIYEVEVTNSGSLDAVVSHTLTNNSNNPAIEITYDGYSSTPVLTEDGDYNGASLQTLEPFDLLKNGGKKYIYITVKYSDSVTSQPNSLTAQATITLNATQKESSSSVGPNTGGSSESGVTFTGTIYRWNTNNVVMASSEAPEAGLITAAGNYITETEYPTYSARVTALGHNYYLKHDVVEDEITTSYVCFIYNNAEHCLKGGDGGASFAANTQIIKDFQTFNNLPDNANPGCSFYGPVSSCFGGGFSQVNADFFGGVSVHGSSSEICGVNADGYSNCDE